MLKNTTEFKKKKNKLSSTLLNLKFMLKTKERIEKDDERKCSEQVLRTEPEDGISYTDYKTVPYAECCELIDGRLSFGGMNREIERLLGIDNGGFKSNTAEVDNSVIKMETESTDNREFDYFKNKKPTKRRDRKRKN